MTFAKSMVISLLLSLFSFEVIAGRLIIENSSEKNLICHIDGYANVILVKPKTKLSLTKNKFTASLNWIECNGLKQRNTHITSSSPNHWFIFNGKAKSVLNVLLYPTIPTYPYGDFSSLKHRMTKEFQALHPDVLLNIVMSSDPALDTYTFANLPKVLGSEGFDIVELDTMLLGEVVQQKLITPIIINPTLFWPVTYQAITYKHLSYGVPSRLCAYYLFSRDKNIQKGYSSLDALIKYLHALPKNKIALISDFNGDWNLPSFYLQFYASYHRSNELDQVLNKTIDKMSIHSFGVLARECNANKDNQCVNQYYHNEPIGTMEKSFAQGKAHNYLGFSEAAFYIKLHSSALIYAALISYGDHFYPLVYTDAYVKNASTCKDPVCHVNFKHFTEYMNTASTQLWINFSEDLPKNMPPRYLLSAIRSFYAEPRVKTDTLYANFIHHLAGGAAYPNKVNEKTYLKFNNDICKNFQLEVPHYRC